jgi:predicted MFS family arabinose efflux permease
VARVALGLGESLLITGALAWGVGLLGPARAGRVMAWSGMAMYGAIAASAPLSLFIGHRYGFAAVVLGAIIAPLLAGLIAWLAPGTPPSGRERMAFYKVLHRVWRAGVGLSLSAVGFAGLAGFAVLHFKEQGWTGASLVMTTFGGAFILARVFFADAPDRYGGKRVGVLSALIEAAGQLLFWLAPGPLVALAGAALTGFGYSLVFPSFGVEAVRKIEPQFKGVALGAYVAFFDLALGVTGPVAGLVANQFGYSAVYLFGLLACSLAALVASRL